MKIDPDTWDDWTSHPLTEALMRACGGWAEEAKAQWMAASWEAGVADPVLLACMRERSKVFGELRDLTRQTIEEAA